jgi:hypothetical protein
MTTGTPQRLTEDMISRINEAVESVAVASGFGQVIIIIEKQVPRWIVPAPSFPLTPIPAPGEKP